MAKRQKINIKGKEILVYSQQSEDYISLTDIARYRDAERSETGCAIEVPLNLWGYGKCLIILILIPSNSMELKACLAQIVLL